MKHVFQTEINGEFIVLRKMTMNDAEDIFRWRTSPVAKYLNHPEGYCLEMQKAWMASRTDDEINYIIYSYPENEKVGMVSILNCDERNGVAEVGRLLLDEKYVGKSNPFGLESLLLTYDYVFNVMDYRKITGTIYAENQRVYELQKYLGMEQEGYLKKHVRTKDGYDDLYVMSLMSEDFYYYCGMIDFVLDKSR